MTLRTEELAAQLKPYVIKWMQNLVLQDTIGRHELGGSLHTGQISDSQAPQFLKTDGSRALSGNLAVSEFTTIDGVDLDVFLASFDLHTLDPDAHHEPVTIVDTASINLSLSGQQLSAVVIPGGIDHGAFAGLGDDDHSQYYNAARHTLTLHTDLGLVPNTRSINTGFGLTGGGNLTADRSLSVVASSDVSSVSAETVLKSTAAGGLTLKQLQVNGDLTVGTNVLNVDQSVGNIGINCVPDAQFDLDVAGNLRAQGWIVGKHAIQVKDARMICHYDGSKTPGDVSFNPTGHMGQVATHNGTVYGGAGKFGKGATFINELTNIVINPSVEIDTTGYSSQSNSTIARTGFDSAFGNYSLLVTPSHATSNNGVRYQVSLTSGQSYAFSSSFKGKSGLKYRVNFLNSSFVSIAYTEIVSNGDWQRVGVVLTAPSTGTYHLQVQPYDNGADFTPFNVDGYLLTNTAYVSPYFDGSFQNSSWSSSDHASTSTSTMGRLTYNNNTVPISTGTVCYWLKIDAITNGAYGQTIFQHVGSTGNFWMYVRPTDGNLIYSWGSTLYASGDIPVDGNYHFVVMTRDNSDTKVYIDGVLSGQVSNTAFAKHSTNPLNIGSLPSSGEERATNGTIDEFAIIDRALNADEIKAIYESDAPIFAETSTWAWRTSNNLAWADANGLWAVDKNTAHAFGVCGVDGYSWGGFGLDAGDIVLGRNVSGSSAIKWDISAGTFGFYGNGGSTPQVEIDTTGTIIAGGTKMNADGVAALEDTGSFGWDEMDYLRKAYKINDASGATKAALGMQSDELILRTSPNAGLGHKTINISSDYSYTWTGINWLQKSSYIKLFNDVEIKARGVVNIVGYDPGQSDIGGGVHVYGYGLSSTGTPSSGDVFVDGKVKSGLGFSHNANIGLTANVAVAKVGGGTRTLKFSGGIYYGYTDS